MRNRGENANLWEGEKRNLLHEMWVLAVCIRERNAKISGGKRAGTLC